jgi:hypothetical protein
MCREEMLVFTQPGEQLLVVLQVRETYGGIKGEKPDKLFLVDIGLQVRHKLVNIGNLGDIVHIFDISKHGIVRLDMGMRIQILACLKIMVRAGIGLTLSLAVNGMDTFILIAFVAIFEPLLLKLSPGWVVAPA